MSNRNIIDGRAVYTKRTQDYIELIKNFTSPELSEIGNYKIIKEIGCGAFGQIYLGYHKLLRVKVCLKRGDRNTQDNFSDNLMREYYYLREFRRHPNITTIYEIIFTETKAYMVLEYYPEGDLFEYLSKRKRIPTDETLKLFTQIVGAAYYMHKSGCCHRDLKLENILLDRKLNVKLSDFGFTRELPFAQHGSKSLLNEFCGTGAYMAPELIRREPYSGVKTDIWSLGVILFTMIAGEMPFDDTLTEDVLSETIVSTEPTYEESIFKGDLLKLIRWMLSKNPDDRPNSLDEVLRLPLLQPYGGLNQIEIVNKLIYNSAGPEITGSDKSLLRDLTRLGLDKDSFLKSIQGDYLDSVSGFWALLKEKNRKKTQKKKIKHRSRSMLRISTSKSFIDNAKLAFSPSTTIANNDSQLNSNNFLSRVDLSQLNESGNLNRSSSFQRKLSLMNSNSNNTNVHSQSQLNLKLEPPPKIHVQSGAISVKSSGTNNNDQKSLKSTNTTASQRRLKFSLKKLFRHKKDKNSGDNKSLPSKSRSTTKSSGELNAEAVETKTPQNSKVDLPLPRKVSTSSTNHIDSPLNADKLLPLSETPTSMLKRNRPTRPGSVISSYSVQTTFSETSNGSGYLTGYSTDIPASHSHQSQVNSSQQQNLFQSANGTNRPIYIRGMSELSSITASSQPDSPNSSFTTLSRSNSMESSSRSLRGRSRRKKSGSSISSNFLIKRGKSPLQSKMNTKWSFNSPNNKVTKNSKNSKNNNKTNKKFGPKAKQQEIIEEEESEIEEEQLPTNKRIMSNGLHSDLMDITDGDEMDLVSDSELLRGNSTMGSRNSTNYPSINGYILPKSNSQPNLNDLEIRLNGLKMSSSEEEKILS